MRMAQQPVIKELNALVLEAPAKRISPVTRLDLLRHFWEWNRLFYDVILKELQHVKLVSHLQRVSLLCARQSAHHTLRLALLHLVSVACCSCLPDKTAWNQTQYPTKSPKQGWARSINQSKIISLQKVGFVLVKSLLFPSKTRLQTKSHLLCCSLLFLANWLFLMKFFSSYQKLLWLVAEFAGEWQTDGTWNDDLHHGPTPTNQRTISHSNTKSLKMISTANKRLSQSLDEYVKRKNVEHKFEQTSQCCRILVYPPPSNTHKWRFI